MAFVAFKKSKMFDAVHAGDIKAVSDLLDKGVSPDLRIGGWQWPALYVAIEKRHTDVALLLLKRGARQVESGLLFAVLEGDTRVAAVLLETHPELLYRKNNDGQTSLHLATLYGFKDMVQLLLEKGLDPHLRDNKDNTAYFYAQKHGQKDIAEILAPLTHDALPLRKDMPGDDWKLLSPEKVSLVTLEKEAGYRFTDIFNFSAREQVRIVHNLETRRDAVETRNFNDIDDKASLEKALAELTRLGGKADPGSISGLLKGKPGLS